MESLIDRKWWQVHLRCSLRGSAKPHLLPHTHLRAQQNKQAETPAETQPISPKPTDPDSTVWLRLAVRTRAAWASPQTRQAQERWAWTDPELLAGEQRRLETINHHEGWHSCGGCGHTPPTAGGRTRRQGEGHHTKQGRFQLLISPLRLAVILRVVTRGDANWGSEGLTECPSHLGGGWGSQSPGECCDAERQCGGSPGKQVYSAVIWSLWRQRLCTVLAKNLLEIMILSERVTQDDLLRQVRCGSRGSADVSWVMFL